MICRPCFLNLNYWIPSAEQSKSLLCQRICTMQSVLIQVGLPKNSLNYKSVLLSCGNFNIFFHIGLLRYICVFSSCEVYSRSGHQYTKLGGKTLLFATVYYLSSMLNWITQFLLAKKIPLRAEFQLFIIPKWMVDYNLYRRLALNYINFNFAWFNIQSSEKNTGQEENTTRGRITVTSSFNKISTDQLGNRMEVTVFWTGL
jgi:hypothetical protein